MQPVQRGDVPTIDHGNAIAFGDYKEARDLLIGRIGDFCSYCEVALHSTVHVEHVQPKSRHKDLKLKWGNFLLACDSCNSTKGSKDVVLDQYFWPDKDNTTRPFVYEVDASPKVAGGLTDPEKEIGSRTLS